MTRPDPRLRPSEPPEPPGVPAAPGAPGAPGAPAPSGPPPPARAPRSFEALLRFLGGPGGAPASDDPADRLAREFFEQSWIEARDGLLARSPILRVAPLDGSTSAPSAFRFELSVRYKRRGAGGRVELAPGPLRGVVLYHADPFHRRESDPGVVVLVDQEHRLLHPNYGSGSGVLCTGTLPAALPLAPLLEHVHRILTYQNVSVDDPADRDAARWFREDPTAREGLEPVPFLY